MGRKWLECGAAQHLSSLACWQHFFPFCLFSFFLTSVEMERLQERALKKKSLECWKLDNAMNHWNIAQQSKTVGVAKVASIPRTVGVAKVPSIPRSCSDELPEVGYMCCIHNGSEVATA